MKRKPKEKVDIDVVPYLSIMVIVLKLICLILIVTVMRIALNPKALKIMSFVGLYQGAATAETEKNPKVPTYFDCFPDGVTVFPGGARASLADLAHDPDNSVVHTLDQLRQNATSEYAVLLVRPRSLMVYRMMRKMIAARNLDVGYDAIDADLKIDWRKEAKDLNIIIPE